MGNTIAGKKNVLLGGIFVLFFSLYFAKGIIVLDPDFGWHIRMGQIILEKGIPVMDPLSYSMAHYPIIDHEWLSNVAIAVLYPHIGMVGLAFLFAGIAIAALLVACSRVPPKMQTWLTIPVFLCGATLISFVGVRTQVLSWPFLALFLKFAFDTSYIYKRWFLMPLLLLFWVNMHGSFAIGIVLLAIVSIARSVEKRTILLPELALLVASVLMTCINPYGVRIWWEVWMQMSDEKLHWAIAEWLPAIYLPNLFFGILLSLSALFIFRYRRRFSLAERGVYIVLSLAAGFSMRHIPLWVVATLPMTARALFWLRQDAQSVKYGVRRLAKAYAGFFVLCLVLFAIHLNIAYFAAWRGNERVFYPVGAVGYLQKYPPKANLWSLYDWNSYIAWKIPGTRVYIDGMMPSWRGHVWKGESPYAFDEYNNILLGKISLKSVVDTYNIDTILLPTEEMEEAFFSDRKLRLTSVQKKVKQMRLKKIYQDTNTAIYTK